MSENELAREAVDAALIVHRELGPGLLESVYERALTHVLAEKNIFVERQVPVTVQFKGQDVGLGFRCDLVLEKKVILEIKSVEIVLPVHKKQMISYLKLTGLKLGLLMNFNVMLLKQGITRVVNNL